MKKTFLYGIGIVLMVLCGCKQEETWYSYDSSAAAAIFRKPLREILFMLG